MVLKVYYLSSALSVFLQMLKFDESKLVYVNLDECLRDFSFTKAANELITCLKTIDGNHYLEVLYETSFGLY